MVGTGYFFQQLQNTFSTVIHVKLLMAHKWWLINYIWTQENYTLTLKCGYYAFQ